MHIPPHDNRNAPIIDVNDARVPLNYFNIVKLARGQAFGIDGAQLGITIIPLCPQVGDGSNDFFIAVPVADQCAQVMAAAGEQAGEQLALGGQPGAIAVAAKGLCDTVKS